MSPTFACLQLFQALGRATLTAVGAVVAPSSCAGCEAPTRRATIFCGGCAATLVRHQPEEHPSLGRLLGFAAYGGAVAAAVRRFKYDGRSDLALPLGHAVRRAVREHALDLGVDWVVPVPLHPLRLAERGYNQSALIARHVAVELAADFQLGLRRTRDTAPQAQRPFGERLENVAQAFGASPSAAGRRIALVDDVATTCATLEACAEAFRRRGARVVAAIVVARAIVDRD